MADKEFLMYKGKPLVRKGDEIYYGDMSEKYVVMLKIKSTKKVGDLDVADKVTVYLMSTDNELDITKRIVKTSDKEGLYNAMDIGCIWLERELKK